jgi:penicillin-binding protein 2A
VDQAAALKRRDLVLERMVKTKAITQQQAMAAKAEQLTFAARKPHLDPAYAFLQQQVLNEINGSLAIRGKEARQLRVTTSIDVNWQRAAAKWDRFMQEQYVAACNGQCESAFVAIQAKSGQLLGFTGSRDFRRSQFNRVTKMERAMGQMILPFVIGASFDNGGHWLQTFGVKMNPQQRQSAQQQIEPTLMDALRGRLHAESMRLLYLNGVGTWQHFINRFSQMWQTSSMNSALGLETVSPIAMARLYAGLLTAHEFGEMTVVREISNASGKTLFERSREIAPEVIPYHVRRLLGEGLRQNMALAATNGRRSVGDYSGYIGYSPNSHDLWAVFATQDVVAVGWFGDERGKHRLTQDTLSLESYQTIDRLWLDFATKLPQGSGQKNSPDAPNAARDIAMVPYTTIWGESMRIPKLVRLARQSDQSLGAEIISQ